MKIEKPTIDKISQRGKVMKYENLIGKTFNRLQVLELQDNKTVLCKCVCGTIKPILAYRLINGAIKSCGCLSRELASQRAKERNETHGLTKSHARLYAIWHSIKQRCLYEKNISYKNYGGRGITICDEWKNDFLSFYNWAIENGYDFNCKRGKCTIDRIDNNGNYEPNNCRWVDIDTQAKNKRNNRYIEFNGETKTITQWAKIFGLSHTTIIDRLKAGYTFEKSILKIDYRKGKGV